MLIHAVFSTASAAAAILFLKGEEQPIGGFLVRENEKAVVIDELLADGSTERRTIARSEIEDLLKTVSPERLVMSGPTGCVSRLCGGTGAKTQGPGGPRDGAAAVPDRRLPGAGTLEGAAVCWAWCLWHGTAEERRFRALAYLLDPAHDVRVLAETDLAPARRRESPPQQAEFLLLAASASARQAP